MKRGIISAGTWVIDHVKIINTWPSQGMLAYILEEYVSTGGAPSNVLMNLSAMDKKLPLYAGGIIGNDSYGEIILDKLTKCNINTDLMKKTNELPTCHTDVMTEKDSGRRTFFHFKGSNSLLNIDHLEKMDSCAKIFHLGYLLLLDKLDAEDKEYGTVAARALDMLLKKGYKTSVDVVSEDSGRFRKIVIPALKYIDYLIINEIEAGKIAGFNIRNEDNKIDKKKLEKTADFLLKNGVREMVAIHFPEGGFAADCKGKRIIMPSYDIEPDKIRGTVGAGDAFCAGMLYGIHESLEFDQLLRIANANAYFNLLSPTSTGGAVSISMIKDFISKHV